MFAAAVLLATYTTFGPIAQTERDVYTINFEGSVLQRVVKDDLTTTPFALTESRYRIAAVDLYGADVLYGTAVRQKISWRPLFGPDSAYFEAIVELVDTEAVHSIMRIPALGGMPRTVLSNLRGVTELAHDESWIYWMEPSSGLPGKAAADAALRRVDKSGSIVETVAAGLTVPYSNQHPFVLVGDDAYISSGASLLRVSKSGGPARAVAALEQGSAIAAVGDLVWFSRGNVASAMSADTDTVVQAFVAQANLPGAAILGAAPGTVIAATNDASHLGAERNWYFTGGCPPAATLAFGRIAFADRSRPFPYPLADPPTAVDDRGVLFRGNRVSAFATVPVGCTRQRYVVH